VKDKNTKGTTCLFKTTTVWVANQQVTLKKKDNTGDERK
jgi:hypothetical protein